MTEKILEADPELLDALPEESDLAAESFDDIITDLGRPLRVCFVCTGNTCRSPMAAAVTNHLCAGRVSAVSCGLYPAVGSPISPNAVCALKNAGIPCTDKNNYEHHTAQEATMTLLSPCDRIYGMSDRHTMLLLTEFPELATKVYSMPQEIGDPWSGSQETYDRCLAKITDCVKEIFSVE
ncbi:MAG: arsenate reductase/protein-tyrosine-phosphatase family protein [Eubacteriales bacterium]